MTHQRNTRISSQSNYIYKQNTKKSLSFPTSMTHAQNVADDTRKSIRFFSRHRFRELDLGSHHTWLPSFHFSGEFRWPCACIPPTHHLDFHKSKMDQPRGTEPIKKPWKSANEPAYREAVGGLVPR